MAGPSPLNSACNCCDRPPTTALNLEFVSKSQSCQPSSCGFTPCASSGNTTCSPNSANFSQQEKCANKRYLVRTTKSGDGRTSTTTCVANENNGCNCTTKCSGTQTTTTEGSGSTTTSGFQSGSSTRTFVTTCSSNTNDKSTKTYNSDCSTTTTKECSGSSSLQTTYTPFKSGGAFSGLFIYSENCSSTVNKDCTSSGTFTQTGFNQNIDYNGTGKVIGNFTNSYPVTGPCCSAGSTKTTVTPDGDKTTIDYSGENSIKVCNPRAMPSFPEFTDCEKQPPQLSNGQGLNNEAYRFTSPTNSRQTSQQEFKFRLKHQPTGTCYLKVWFKKVVQKYKNSADACPVLIKDGDPIKEDFDEPYEWEASGYPCFEDKEKAVSDCENTIYSEPKTVTAEENQSVTIKIEKWSMLKDYEPDDPDDDECQGCKPDGFPIPNPADCPTCNG